MEPEKKYTIDELRRETGKKKAEFAKLAGISLGTYYRIVRRESNVSDEMIQSCLLQLNRILQTSYTLKDINR